MSERLTIVGVGLIGGSFGLALKAAGFDGEIVGCGRREQPLERAVELGAIDHWSTDPAEAAADADTVLLAVPMLAMRKVLEQLAGTLPGDAIVTDAGSSKGSFVRDARMLDNPGRVVPGHPIAGTEHSGVEAAFATLFVDRRVILTPTQDTDRQALLRVENLWRMTGAIVETTDVQTHDRLLAATSHLPHMLAFGLVATLAGMQEEDDIFRYAAGGFRDFTRIASSDPVMWRDVCIANRDALLEVLNRYHGDLQALTELIERGDSERILELFQRAKTARDAHVGDLG
ncbi:MAG: prephenate dehydrogenase/arogenate dehydrogenase family protein [Gammaproteobacteria bacterium]|nr:prephenate dehydrogenase/arogenate dehydrogenase family protein [Gammaproteobacteria bacterium]